METSFQENENIPLKFDITLFQVTLLCYKFISLKTALTIMVQISRRKIQLI